MAIAGRVSMDVFADASKASGSISLKPFMETFIVLGLLNIVFSVLMKESSMIRKDAVV